MRRLRDLPLTINVRSNLKRMRQPMIAGFSQDMYTVQNFMMENHSTLHREWTMIVVFVETSCSLTFTVDGLSEADTFIVLQYNIVISEPPLSGISTGLHKQCILSISICCKHHTKAETSMGPSHPSGYRSEMIVTHELTSLHNGLIST